MEGDTMRKEITCKDGKKIVRISRWIKLRTAWDITPRHSLYDFCTDENGRIPYQNGFDATNGTQVTYFRFKNHKYALDQFLRCGSAWVSATWQWEENDKLQFISGVQYYGFESDSFNPLLIEIDEGGEYVRVYEEVSV